MCSHVRFSHMLLCTIRVNDHHYAIWGIFSLNCTYQVANKSCVLCWEKEVAMFFPNFKVSYGSTIISLSEKPKQKCVVHIQDKWTSTTCPMSLIKISR